MHLMDGWCVGQHPWVMSSVTFLNESLSVTCEHSEWNSCWLFKLWFFLIIFASDNVAIV